MPKKLNHLQKQLKFHCSACRNVYQLLEIQPKSSNCSTNCSTKWQAILHDYYQEKVLAYLALQEEVREKAQEKSENWDWTKKPTK